MESERKQRVRRQRPGPPSRPAWRWSHVSCFLSGMLLIWVTTILVRHFRAPEAPTAPGAASTLIVTSAAWGVLKEETLMLERPAEAFRDAAPQEIRWVFGGLSFGELPPLFRTCGLTEAQQARLLDEHRWQSTPAGVVVRPPLEVVRDMNAGTRRRLYDVLSQTAENIPQRFPYVFRGPLAGWLAGSQLSAGLLREVQEMTYTKGEVSVFADLPYFQLTASNEVRELARAVSRVPAILLGLELNGASDLERLKRYWLSPSEQAEMEPLLGSLARVPGGTTVSVASLLPPVPRLLLYSYPQPRANFPRNPDCVWSSMNFFNEEPDNRFADEQFTGAALNNEYHRVPAADALGDIILLHQSTADGGMKLIHMCVHVANDVVFTKNGGDMYQPWVLMRLQDVKALFPNDTGMKTAVFRRNS